MQKCTLLERSCLILIFVHLKSDLNSVQTFFIQNYFNLRIQNEDISEDF